MESLKAENALLGDAEADRVGKTTTQTSIVYAHITTISHKSRTERSRTQSTMAAATAQPDTPAR